MGWGENGSKDRLSYLPQATKEAVQIADETSCGPNRGWLLVNRTSCICNNEGPARLNRAFVYARYLQMATCGLC